MKRRIGTILYDTDAAVLIGTTQDGVSLYRTRRTLSYFSVRDGILFALDADAAKAFMSAHGIAEPTKERKDKTTIAAYVPTHLAEWVQDVAKRRGITQSEYIAELIRERYDG